MTGSLPRAAFGLFLGTLSWMTHDAIAQSQGGTQGQLAFPDGTATSSQVCGACHVAIYREFASGFGADLQYPGMVYRSADGGLLTMPATVSSTGTAHSLAGIDPWPIHAREAEEEGRACNVCHFPQAFEIPDIDVPEVSKPQPRAAGQETGGLTCASCHLTPDGRIRGPYVVTAAPHATVYEPKMQTSAMCAYCHAMGPRVVGKQTQTFLEWRKDFHEPGLGRQHCQDCHMPRTLRKTAEAFDVPIRAVGRHLWTGGHSAQRIQSALQLVLVQPEANNAAIELHVINIGAGHSVPTGSNRRGIYLDAEVVDTAGEVVTVREWLFAPWYGNRPDDRAFLGEDEDRPDAMAVMQADAQGPHEAPVRAGEERVLSWPVDVPAGSYTVHARLTYDLNRYNERSFVEDQTEIGRGELPLLIDE